MTTPSAKVEVEFTSGVWTDVSNDLVQANTKRGRQFDLDIVQPGTASVTLENALGDYTPERTAGAYYPNVVPRKRLRITDVTSGAALFLGRIERWSPRFDNGGSYHFVDVTVVDDSKFLNTPLQPVAMQELLADSPLGIWPLSETSGSSFANVARTSAPAGYVASFPGSSGGYDVGSDPILPGNPGANSLGLHSPDLTLNLVSGIARFPGAFSSGTAAFSAEQWFLATPYGTANDPTFIAASPPDGQTSTLWLAAYHNNTLFLNTRTVSYGINVNVTNGALHHVAWTVASDKRTVNVYLDGQLIYNVTFGFDLNIAGHALSMAGSSSNTIPTRMALASTYATELSAARIAAHYQAGLGAFGETEAQRISRILGYTSNTASLSLDGGVSTLGAAGWTSGATAWSEASKAAADAGGVLFIGPSGAVTYRNRQGRSSATSAFTLAESTGTAVEAGLTFDISEQGLVNDAIITPASGNPQRATNPTSITTYGSAPYTDASGVISEDEAYQRAVFLVRRKGTPTVQVQSVTAQLTTFASQGVQNAAVASDIGTRLTMAELPSTAPWSSHDFFVEGVSHQVSRADRPADGGDLWQVTWNVSQPDTQGVWVLNDATLGVLGTTTIPAY